MSRSSSKIRLKLVGIGPQRLLYLRVVGYQERMHAPLVRAVLSEFPEERRQFDGEVFRLHGEGLDALARRAAREGNAVYDPNLERDTAALPNPWPIPAEPPRDHARKPRIYMARVRHPELAEALAFQTRDYDDDFLIDFRRATNHLKPWRRYHPDFKAWAVAEHYEDVVHRALDRHYECWWDEFMAGEEWDLLPPPPDTRYPIRALTAEDFALLRVPPYCSIADLNHGYRLLKESYEANRISPDEWMDVDEAYGRIRRHHFPPDDDALPPPVGPQAILLLLRDWLPDPDEQSRWFHAFNHGLGGTPADLVKVPADAQRVANYVRVMMTIMPAVKDEESS
jgi:hypothetical protein